MTALPGAPRLDVLGVPVSPANIGTAIDEVDRWIRDGYHSYATLTGVHGIMESVQSLRVLSAHHLAGLVLPDGMPLVWLLWLGGFGLADRVCGPDLMQALFKHSEETGHRHFLYGATPGTIDRLRENLERKFPAVKIVGTYAPPFRPAGAPEGEDIIKEINDCAPDIVWVGLSTPKQELWMANHRHRLEAPALIGVGAAFDFHAGSVRRAPRWMQRSGLEWTFRLAMDPKRLAGRYLRNNPRFLALLAAEKLGLRATQKNQSKSPD